MKLVITESQYNKILSEQSSQPIKIDCRSYDKIDTICGKLKLTKQHGDIIIKNNRENAKKELMDKLDKFIDEIKKKEKGTNQIMSKFTETIESLKNQIVTYLDGYYPQAVYSSIGVQKPLDSKMIMYNLVKFIYDNTFQVWENSFVYKNAAKLYVTKKNINFIKKEAKFIWDLWLDKFGDLVDIHFVLNLTIPISRFEHELSKTSPICKKVIVTQDYGCNKLPKDKWFYPRMKYDTSYSFNESPTSQNTLKYLNSIYWTKVDGFLNELV